MQEYPLFPKVIRLVLYAGTAVASMASVPTIIKHAQKVVAPVTGEETSSSDSGVAPAKAAPPHAGTISILPVGPQTALHRQTELAALRAKLATSRPAD